MNRYLRILAAFVAALMLLMSLTACADNATTDETPEENNSGVSKAVELYGTDYEYTVEEFENLQKPMFAFMPTAPSLYEAFSDYFYVGGCINSSNLTGKGEDFTAMMKQFNSFVLENEFKPQSLHPEENRYNFDTADRFVEFGEEYGVRLRGHTLLWHAQCPDWFYYKSGNSGEFADPEKILKRIDEHVTTIVSRYKGKIDSWDVVNEVFNDDGTLRNSLWLQSVGDADGDGDSYDYIEQAFKSARAADPDTRLIINDYNLEWSHAKTQGVFDVVKSMLEDGIKVDGVGLQMHIGYDTNIETLRENLEILAGLKEYNPDIKIEVTEMDMSCFKWGDNSKRVELTDEFMAQYNKTYTDAFKLFMEFAERDILDSVTFWGINDDHTWLNSDGRIQHPFLIGSSNRLKDTYWQVISLALK